MRSSFKDVAGIIAYSTWTNNVYLGPYQCSVPVSSKPTCSNQTQPLKTALLSDLWPNLLKT